MDGPFPSIENFSLTEHFHRSYLNLYNGGYLLVDVQSVVRIVLAQQVGVLNFNACKFIVTSKSALKKIWQNKFSCLMMCTDCSIAPIEGCKVN